MLPSLYFICGIDLYQDLADKLANQFNSLALYVEQERAFLEGDDDADTVISTKELASHYVRTILSEGNDNPVVLCGISYGGLLALEVATQLEKKGLKAEAVFLLDSTLPSGWRKTNLLLAWQFSRRVFFKALDFFLEKRFGVLDGFFKNLHRITLNKRLAIKQDARLTRAIEAAEVKEMTYSGEIVLVKALDVGRQSRGIVFKSDYGWQEALGRSIVIHSVEGDHLGIIDDRNAVNVAKVIERYSGKKVHE